MSARSSFAAAYQLGKQAGQRAGNVVRIHYCYPSSDMARQLGRAGYYVTVGVDSLVISGPLAFLSLAGAEGFCRNKCLTWEPHGFSGPDVG
jgi:hypothetical protein